MKIKLKELDRLATELMKRYRTTELLQANSSEDEIKNKIVTIVSQNFAEEQAIEEEARRMLSSHAQAARNMDPYKMFLIAKQKLAAKKGFVL